MAAEKVKGVFTADISGYTSAMSRMTSSTKSATGAVLGGNKKGSGSMIKFGAVTGAAMAIASKAIHYVGQSVGYAVDRFDTLNKYPKVMRALGYSTKDTNKSMRVLNKGIDGLPTSLDDITKSAQNFAPLTGGATSGAKAAVALNDAFLASGASVADASRGMTQYSQMLATGKVDLMSYRTLQETMPIALRKVANAFGFTGKSAEQDLFQALKKGKITVDDLNKKFVELDKGQNGFAELSRKNSVGIRTSFANIKTSVVKGLASMLTAIDTGLAKAKLPGIAQMMNNMKYSINKGFDVINKVIIKDIPIIVNSFKKIFDFAKQNADWLKPLTLGILTFIATFNGIQKVVGIVSKVGGAFKNFFSILAANPIVAVIATIAALTAGLVYFFTQTKTGQAIWQAFTTWLVNAWNTIKTTAVAVWTGIATFFSTLWNGIVTTVTNVWTTVTTFLTTVWTGIQTIATTIWNNIKTFLTTIWSGISSVVMSVWSTISAYLSGVWTGIMTIASGIWNMIKAAILGPVLLVIDLVTGNFAALKSDVMLIWNSIKSAASSIWNGTKAVIQAVVQYIKTIVTSIFNGLKSVVISIWNGIKSVSSSVWNGIKSAVSSAAKALSSAVKSTWNALKSAASSIWNGIKSTISSAINGARSAVSSAVNGMKSAASSAWNSMKSVAHTVVSSIKSVFHSLSNIDLGAAGRAIMNSFKSGLTSAFSSVKKFVSGIGSWIRKHKGPISYDRRLLIPAGNAIMNGFNSGLTSQFAQVQKNVATMASRIAGQASNSIGRLDSQMSPSLSVSRNINDQFDASFDDSGLARMAQMIVQAINDKDTDLILDGDSVVKKTSGRMDNELGNNVRLRSRFS
ncbi:hypothetical protein FC65_GL001620 [Ligilactobacillus acidipiscis DSM 15836]|uniref:Tape measure protein N-terminal domain-containing protein n=1 Tax=Ligilactobacillus acidipiscis DSM 15836 TaxID=1423716 RepID=A0ABR5PKA6_9LACO|nr:tape measure protein [Ligilactobacillus acidipiscis]KRM28718.1 hypothetical protein FC65_GL001620 [Ligilactobacillus acidipiscis DSM 15836]GAW63382.1 tail tape measure protein [Ligilactobacillus acidipiscis]GEN19591.1 hypothetical protein LAC02_28720 [Ligilactobacillus acidipiscis]